MTRAYIKKLAAKESAHGAELQILERALLENYGVSLSEKEIALTDMGKPYFADGFPFFNFSNCRGYVAVAISDTEVGIDIERVRKISDALCRRYLGALPEGDAERTLMWTRYESLGKKVGTGVPHSYKEEGYTFSGISEGDVIVSVCTDGEKCVFEWL